MLRALKGRAERAIIASSYEAPSTGASNMPAASLQPVPALLRLDSNRLVAPDRATAPAVSTINRIGLEAPVLRATLPFGIRIAIVCANDRRGETPGPFDAGARQTHGIRYLYPDRQQRLVALAHFATVQAELRPQPRSRAKGRALRLRLPLVHG